MRRINDHVSAPPRTRAGMRMATMILAALGACTIPTDAPVTDVRWVVPGQTTRIGLGPLLPNNVGILADSSAFTIGVNPPPPVTRTLGTDCAQCVTFAGQVAAKPQFTGTASSSTSLPTEISSATLTGGTLTVNLLHNYNFDPLRPSAAAGSPTGFAVIVVTNNGVQIGKDSVNGLTTAFPANTPLVRPITLTGNITGSQPVTVTLTVFSPPGDPIVIDPNRSLTVSGSVANVRVASASVLIQNKTVNSQSTYDLSGIDQSIIDHVLQGTLQLTLANPFNAGGPLNIVFNAGGGTVITKQITLSNAATSTASVTFQASELKQILGKNVTITYSGPVNATGAVTITPKQVIVVQTRLDLTLELGTIKTS